MQLRQKIRNYPHLYAWLLPLWIRYHHQWWQVRNFITWNRPISFRAGDHVCQLYPKGQIVEAVYFGYFERDELDFVSAYLQPGMCVVDVGANIGLYTVLASTMVDSTGVVHAFEPSTITYRLLLRNLELNGCQNVTANRLALSNTSEEMVLRADPCHPALDGHRFIQRAGEVGTILSTDEIVPCVTLDDYAFTRDVGPIDFIKVDVEGAEWRVLQGATAILACAGDLTLMLECSKNKSEVARLLAGYGYSFYMWDVSDRLLKSTDFGQAVETGNVIVRRNGWSD